MNKNSLALLPRSAVACMRFRDCTFSRVYSRMKRHKTIGKRCSQGLFGAAGETIPLDSARCTAGGSVPPPPPALCTPVSRTSFFFSAFCCVSTMLIADFLCLSVADCCGRRTHVRMAEPARQCRFSGCFTPPATVHLGLMVTCVRMPFRTQHAQRYRAARPAARASRCSTGRYAIAEQGTAVIRAAM